MKLCAVPGPLELTIVNQQKRVRLSPAWLSGRVRSILRLLGWRRVRMSLVLMDDRGIRRLHRKHLGKDRSTDVLAFGPRRKKPFPPESVPFLGDVVVSVETARRIAPQFGNRWEEEFLLYVCHGILHLMGYRDSTARGKARMDRKQERVLQKISERKWQSKRPKHSS